MSQTTLKSLHKSPLESPRTLWALAIGFLIIWFYMLGARTLVPTDEGRYAEMGREMLASGDWITLRLNGIKYFEKPPLQNWMNAISFALFGLGDWQARLWTGLCGLIGVAAVWLTGKRVYSPRVGVIAALVLGSSFYWAGMGHVNSLDMGLSGMMALTMCGLLLGQRDGVSATEQRNAMLICWAGMALATMSKGLIGFVLPGTVLILYTLITRDWRLWTRLHFGKGLLLFFAITAPWFILIALKNPEHPHFFFIHEHFDRFTSGVHKRGGAWHYFFPLLALGIIPWLGALIQGLLSGMKKAPTRFQPSLMLLIWAVFFFFFFSISGSKLPGYILPIFPALAILIAVQLEQSGSRSLQLAAILMVLLGLAGLLGVGKAIDISKDKPAIEQALSAAYANWLYVVAALALLGGAVSWLLARKPGNGKDWAIIVLATSGYLLGQIAFLGHEPWGRYIAGSAHIPAIQKELVSTTTPIYAVGRYEQALPFYLQRTVILVEFPDEMQFGLQQQPELWIPKREDFVAKWQAHQQAGEPAVAIMRDDVYDDLKKAGVAMRVIAQDPKRIIVAVPAAK
ncbi:glycosyltransferase family 39 protein [Undibacterium crateris]|uniref:glycosyltransferase family 39 protein n=1 Tax=Undibacterium crateris TaxID=2528175 RepID=UPI00138A4F18|nr:glycosyltransferase family 39 protein [Undibacterium crateris]NDI84311.1 phospholipid carrier-dependent glycosyltransferase [Undibacterium crateris]